MEDGLSVPGPGPWWRKRDLRDGRRHFRIGFDPDTGVLGLSEVPPQAECEWGLKERGIGQTGVGL